MAWDQGYYQDQNYSQDQYYPQDQYDSYYAGYDNWGYAAEPAEDTESEKLRKDQAEKEALESNRLFLKKVKKQCVKEDFVDLQQQQLFLFEVLIEFLEVQSTAELGLVPASNEARIAVRAQFLNSPYLEISEVDKVDIGGADPSEKEYIQSLHEAGLNDAVFTNNSPNAQFDSLAGEEGGEEEVKYETKWENSSGKSCLFSMTALDIIQDLERFPVHLQVCRCLGEHTEPLGYGTLRLPSQFSLSVLQSCRPGVVLPVSAVHRETCELANLFGVKKGKVDVFVRLSCFGPAIITSFRTEGTDRKYVFKPSPMESGEPVLELEVPRTEVLRPIFAEEDRAVGITVLKEHDIFQRPVVWKIGPQKCVCMGKHYRKEVSSELSLRMPLSSKSNLCKDVIPPTDHSSLRRFGKPLCDWHNLVGLEVKNSPGGNCCCLPGTDTEKLPTDTEVSRIVKMTAGKALPPIPRGLGMGPEPTDCGCHCFITRELLDKNLFIG